MKIITKPSDLYTRFVVHIGAFFVAGEKKKKK